MLYCFMLYARVYVIVVAAEPSRVTTVDDNYPPVHLSSPTPVVPQCSSPSDVSQSYCSQHWTSALNISTKCVIVVIFKYS